MIQLGEQKEMYCRNEFGNNGNLGRAMYHIGAIFGSQNAVAAPRMRMDWAGASGGFAINYAAPHNSERNRMSNGSNFSTDDLHKVARLARLDVSDADAALYSKNLTDILAMVAQLDAADTDGVTPMAHPLHMHQRLRPDAVTEPNRRDEYQAIAPATEAEHYTVPKVIE